MYLMLTPTFSACRSLGVAALALTLAACGGGSASAPAAAPGGGGPGPGAQPLTGVFIDSAVGGIGFRTATQEGVTNSAGEFTYEAGEAVTFFIGALELPEVVAGETITPLDIAGTEDPADQTALNIARLLQSIDSDGNADNGITINPEAAGAAEGLEVDFDLTESEFDMAVASFVGMAGGELVSEAEALDHLNDSLLFLALNGGTLLESRVDNGVNYHVVVTFSDDGSIVDVNDDDFGQAYDSETNSYRANIWEGTWTLDGDRVCTTDAENMEDCWYMSLSDNHILSYTDEAKTDLVFTDSIAEHVEAEKLLGNYRLTIEGYDDECNTQVECYFEFSADGTLIQWEFDVVDEASSWVIDGDGNLRITFYEDDGTTERGVGRFYIGDVTGADSYEGFNMIAYVDLNAEFPVMLEATMTRVD